MAIAVLRGVTKTYRRGQESVPVLRGLNLEVAEGAFEAFMGPSGSGKSTLLNLLAGLEKCTEGIVNVLGFDLSSLDDEGLTRFRAQNLGFIFQSYNLLPVLTATENVALPLLLTSLSAAERKKRARTALGIVGLEGRMDHFPSQLSGGQ